MMYHCPKCGALLFKGEALDEGLCILHGTVYVVKHVPLPLVKESVAHRGLEAGQRRKA